MKRLASTTTFVVLFILFSLTTSICPAQTLDKSNLSSTLQTTSIYQLEAELNDINVELERLQRILSIYTYYGIEGAAKDNAESDYENYDQKANQIFQLLSSIQKMQNDASKAVVRNLL